MELKDRDRRAISSSPSSGIRTVRSSVRAMCSTAPVSSSTGRSPVRATHRPAAPAPTTPIPHTRISTQVRVDSGLSMSASGLAMEMPKTFVLGAACAWRV